MLFPMMLCIVCVPTSPSEPERWFVEWSKTLDFASLHAEFSSELPLPSDSGESEKLISKGTWDLQLKPTYAQYLSLKAYRKGKLVTDSSLSWDEDEGISRALDRKLHTLRCTAEESHVPSKVLGMSHYPSDSSFFHIRGRSIFRLLRSMNVTVTLLDEDGKRVVAFLNGAKSNDLHALVFDRSKEQPLIEQRLYVRSEVLPADFLHVYSDLGDSIPLPKGFESAQFFVNKQVIASSTVKNHQIPTAWRIRHCVMPPDKEVIVRLTPETIAIDGYRPEHGFLVTFPPGSLIMNTFEGKAYHIDGDGKRVLDEVITELDLEAILEAADLHTEGVKGSAEIQSEPQVTGCGANALYLVLRMLRKYLSLKEITDALGIRAGQPVSSLASLVRVAEGSEVRALAVRGDSSILHTAVGKPVILHVKRTGSAVAANEHYVVVDAFDNSAQTIRIFDPPNLPYRSSIKKVEEAWTGNAVLFGAAAVERFSQNATSWRPWVFGAIGVLVLLLPIVVRYRTRIAAALFFLCFLGCSHEKACSENKEEVRVEKVRVLGSPIIDFGRIKRGTKNLRHTFVLQNTTKERIAIVDIRRNCACMNISAEPKELAANAKSEVGIELDTLAFWGHRKATARVVFDDDSAKPLSLQVNAYIEKEYMVRVRPMVWTLPSTATPKSVLKRTFTAREFVSEITDDGANTAVLCEDENIRVTSVSDWKNSGSTNAGACREATITMECTVPENFGDFPFVVRFERPLAKSSKQQVVSEVHVLLQRV